MEQLGITTRGLLPQIVNVLIMTVLLSRFLYKPILKTLEERKKKIEQGLKDAEAAKLELEKSEEKREEVIKKAKDEARVIVEDAKKSGKKLEEQIVERAHQEAAEIIAKAKKDIEFERADMEKELKSQTVEVASMMAEKVIEQVLTESNQKALIEEKLKAMSKNG